MIEFNSNKKFAGFSKNIKYLIFDFDGVVAETLDIKTEGFKYIYKSCSNKDLSAIIYHHNDNHGLSRYEKIKFYHKKFLNIDLNDNELNKLASIFSKKITREVINSKIVYGFLKFINLTKLNYTSFISTGTPQKEINKILLNKKINHYFKEVFGSPEKKIFHIKKIMKNYNITNNHILFFGDAIVDYEASKKYNIKFILREHKYNKKIFKNIDCVKINNFKFKFTE